MRMQVDDWRHRLRAMRNRLAEAETQRHRAEVRRLRQAIAQIETAIDGKAWDAVVDVDAHPEAVGRKGPD